MSGSSLSKSQLTTPMQAKLQEQLSIADAEVILRRFLERIQAASIARE